MRINKFLLFNYALNLTVAMVSDPRDGYPPANLILAVLCAVLGCLQAITRLNYERRKAAEAKELGE